MHGADLIGARRDLVADGQRVVRGSRRGGRQHARAGIAQRHVHGVGQRAVGAGLPVLAAVPRGAGEDLLALRAEDELGVLGDRAGGPVDVADHVLRNGVPGPEELPGLPVQRIDDAGLAGNPGHDPAGLAGLDAGVDPGDLARIRRDGGVDQEPLERMVEVPTVVQVLVVPDDFAGVGVEGQGGVVVEVLVVDSAQHELGGRRGDRGPHVDQVQLGIEARHHPRPDVRPLLVGHAAPRLVARLAGSRNQAPPPELLAGPRVVGHDDARLGPAPWPAAPPGDHLAVGDDRTGRVPGGILRVVEELRFPDQLAGRGVQREGIVVVGGVDDHVVPDRDVPVDADQPAQIVVDVVGDLAPILPLQVAGHRIDGLDDVVRVRHVQRAAVRDRRSLLRSRRESPRPDHAQVAYIVAVDLIERAVAPAVQRPAPHQPVAVRRILKHGVGDGNELGVRRALSRHGASGRQEEHGGQQESATADWNRMVHVGTPSLRTVPHDSRARPAGDRTMLDFLPGLQPRR